MGCFGCYAGILRYDTMLRICKGPKADASRRALHGSKLQEAEPKSAVESHCTGLELRV